MSNRKKTALQRNMKGHPNKSNLKKHASRVVSNAATLQALAAEDN